MTRPLSTMLVAVAAVAAAASAAHAQGAGDGPPGTTVAAPARDDPSGSVWYGWQILIADGTSAAAAITSAVVEFDSGRIACTVGFLIIGPGIHLGRGHVTRGLGSAALRVGLPALGLAIGSARANGPDDIDKILIPAAVGVILASAIDVALIARDHAPDRYGEPRPGLIQAGGVAASPTLLPTTTGAVLPGLVGTF